MTLSAMAPQKGPSFRGPPRMLDPGAEHHGLANHSVLQWSNNERRYSSGMQPR